MIIVSREFSPADLVAGHPAFDLVNTVTARNTASPRDWLDGYERVLEWARLANIVEQEVLTLLGKRAALSPASTAHALSRLKRFREALHSAYAALLSGTRIPQSILDELEVDWLEAQHRRHLNYSDRRVTVNVSVERSGLDLIRDCIAGSAIPLMQALPTDRARVCRGRSCGWLFIDSSKGGQRVWCDMATCGNAAKTRRHQDDAVRRRLSARRRASRTRA